MKKKELLAMDVLTVTPAIRDKVQQDHGEEKTTSYGYLSSKTDYTVTVYQRYRYFRAAVQNDILKIAIFQRASVAAGRTMPDFTVFIEKENGDWITYNHREDSWSKAMIFNLPYNAEDGEMWGMGTWEAERDQRQVEAYLGLKGNIRKIISTWQQSIKTENNRKAHQKEIDAIDEFMDEVPAIPKDFENWIKTSGLKDAGYMVMYAGKLRKHFCTHCQKMVNVKEKHKHGDMGKCPSCHAQVKYKFARKQKVLDSSKRVVVIQKTSEDEYVERLFNVWARYRQENDYRLEMSYEEYGRIRLNRYFRDMEEFEMGEWRYTGVRRWIHAVSQKWGCGRWSLSDYGCLYDRNMQQLLQDTEAQYVPVREFLRRNCFPMYSVQELMHAIIEHPQQAEKLMKVKLDCLMNCMADYYDDTCDKNGRTLEEILKLNKNNVRMAIRMNAGALELKILRAYEKARMNPQESLVSRLAVAYRYSGENDIVIRLQRGKIEKTMNYLDKLVAESGNDIWTVVRDYEDYLSQLGRLAMPIEENRFPTGFYTMHDRLTMELQIKADEVKRRELAKMNRQLKRHVKVAKELYHTDSKKYIIVWPKDKKDFLYEATIQHNCVATNYFKPAAQGETTIFFLRRSETPHEPFCTVEFKDGKCIQCRIKNNQNAPDDVMKLMERISKTYQKEMKKRAKETMESSLAYATA